jgi:sugar phosphate isomerase/epimerase
VRMLLHQKAGETLAALEKIGYSEVEAPQDILKSVWDSLQNTRLKPVSVHADASLFAPGREADLDAAIADARGHRVSYFVHPGLPPAGRSGGLDAYRKLAERLNAAGERCRGAGLRLCYHNHAFEYEEGESRVPIDLLMEITDDKLVALELDTFWTSVAGYDPVMMLRRYADRVPLAILMDKAEGYPLQYTDTVPRGAFKELGAGVLNIPAILQAGGKAGVRYYFVGQDQSPGDPLKSLAQSYDYLNRVRF